MTTWQDRIKNVTYPLFTFFLLLVIWQVSISVFNVPNYILPDLRDVGDSLWRGYYEGAYWRHFSFTVQAMLIGYVCGSILALVLGALVAEIKTVERFVFAFVVALQSVPKVALAPLIIVWFGFGIESKIVLVALICFFPTFINTIAGMRSVPPNLIAMMRSFGASPMRILFEVKIPHAAGSIFSGLQVGIILGLIGAVVGEFIASTRGLGHLIQNSANALDLGAVFAAIISLAVIGITGSQILRQLHHRIVFWERSAARVSGKATEGG